VARQRDKETIDKQVAGLRASKAELNQETIKKVNKVIDSMKRKKIKINFQSVAKEAKVSRATLYNNDPLKERILGLREISKAKSVEGGVIAIKDKKKLQEEKIIALRKRVKELEEEKKKLIDQLIQMEELKMENERLKNRTTQSLHKGGSMS
jgi:co-chaperonin GroES (HSP10)